LAQMSTVNEVIKKIKPGLSVMVGGFLGVGVPHRLIDALVDAGVDDLIIIANDTGFPEKGVGKLVVNKQVKEAYVSHIGTNPETARQMNSGELTVHLIPQGTLAERIRCGGAGLGGVLTPTGVGTIVAENKQVIITNGKEYLLEEPLKADVALIKGHIVDKMGNVLYNKTAENFNPLMAMAADTVIVEANRIVDVGELDPNIIKTPGIFVDYIISGE
jgi:acetate CoA/acetoacetate CoA-transferase alpha subunit